MRIELTTPAKIVVLAIVAVLIALAARTEGPAARRYLKMETM